MQNGNLAVADYDNKCVTVFEPSGKFVNRIGVGKLLGQYYNRWGGSTGTEGAFAPVNFQQWVHYTRPDEECS